MRLRDIYANRNPAISVEFFPPRTDEGDAALAARVPAIARLKPDYVTVTYGAGGSGRDRTLGWVRRLRHDFGLDVLCHLTCVGQSRAEVGEVLDQLRALDVDKIIALRGDPPKGVAEWTAHPDGYRYASELVAEAVARGFSVAVAGFPEGHPESPDRASDIRHLKAKVDAGAESIGTQLFLDNDDYTAYVADARAAGVTVPVIPGILPFKSAAHLRRFCSDFARTMTGAARIPEALETRLTACAGDEAAEAALGLDYATEQCRDLLDRGAPGLHFYCLNESQAVETILERLQLAPAKG